MKYLKCFRKITSAATLAVIVAGCAVNPSPLTDAELQALREARWLAIDAGQSAIGAELTLYEAMARALKYNLDYKIELMEVALRQSKQGVQRFDMLPTLAASAGYTKRNNYSGASSSEIIGSREIGTQSLVSSTSTERETHVNELSFGWDILDFGLSYARAHQLADEVLIAEENKRKIVDRIVADVRTAYWRALSAQNVLSDLQKLEQDVRDAIDESSRIYNRRNADPMKALHYQRELLEIQNNIQGLNREFSVAKAQLSALVNVKPGTSFSLVEPVSPPTRSLELGVDSMVTLALENRPELNVLSYEQRINRREAEVALFELLPGLKLFGRVNYSDNEYLYNQDWVEHGLRASWNVMNMFRYPARSRQVKAQQQLLDQRSLAMTMAVITQVHVSRVRYALAKDNLDGYREYHHVQDRILEHNESGYRAGRISKQLFIKERLNSILAKAKYDRAFSDFHNAYAGMIASIGMNPLDYHISGEETVLELSDKFQNFWRGTEQAALNN